MKDPFELAAQKRVARRQDEEMREEQALADERSLEAERKRLHTGLREFYQKEPFSLTHQKEWSLIYMDSKLAWQIRTEWEEYTYDASDEVRNLKGRHVACRLWGPILDYNKSIGVYDVDSVLEELAKLASEELLDRDREER